MPRPCLPDGCDTLRTMNVLLTKHTEDDILKHMLSCREPTERILDKYVPILDSEIYQTTHNNPYKDLNWKKHYEYKFQNKVSPFKQRYEKTTDIFPCTEEMVNEMSYLGSVKRDISICDRIFKWSETNDEFQEMEYKLISKIDMFHEEQKELVFFDTLAFRKSKEDWDKANTEYLAEYQLRLDHRKHQTREEYEAKMKERFSSPEAIDWYGGEEGYRQHFVFVDTSETCKYCIEQARLRKEKQERDRLREEQDRIWREEEAKKMEQETIQKVVVPVVVAKFDPKTCDCCQFVGTTNYEWTSHINSKEHMMKEKLKKTYCSVCEIQCKNDADYQVHLQTQKHKKKCGNMPSVYRCEACNYETTIKRNYELHCGTKKHKDQSA
jgi:hypothetical protein